MDRYPVPTISRPHLAALAPCFSEPITLDAIVEPEKKAVDSPVAPKEHVLAAYRPPQFTSEVQAELEMKGNENRSNRLKYTCSGCGLNVWGKPQLRIKCVDCDQLLQAALF